MKFFTPAGIVMNMGLFSNAEVCLLCDKNIQLENSKLQLRVNHHVRVEKMNKYKNMVG